MTNNNSLRHWEQEDFPAQCLDHFFLNPDVTFSIKNPDQSSKAKTLAITPKTRELALRSHLYGESVPYAINKKGSATKGVFKGDGLGLAATPLDRQDQTGWICFDLDGGAGHAHSLADVDTTRAELVSLLSDWGIASYWDVSRSGNGRHIWIFSETRIPALEAREVGLFLAGQVNAPLLKGGLANAHKNQGIEVFPKALKYGVGGGVPVFLPYHFEAVSKERGILHNPKGRPIQLPELEYCHKGHLNRAIFAALSETRERNEAKAKELASYRSLTSAVSFVGTHTQPGLEGVALVEVSKLLNIIATDPDSSRVFSLFMGIASWVNGGHLDRDETTQKVEKACQTNGSKSLPSSWYRQWMNALSKAPAKTQGDLPKIYAEQLAKAKELADTETALALVEARERAKTLIKSFISPPQRLVSSKLLGDFWVTDKTGIGVLAGDPGLGKTHSVVEMARTHKILLALPTHDAAREWANKATELGIPSKRFFSPTSAKGLLDEKGERVCKISLEVLEERLINDYRGSCTGCTYKPTCPAAKGWEGSEDANLALVTHAGLVSKGVKRILENPNFFLVIDEFKDIWEQVSVSLEDLSALASCDSLTPEGQCLVDAAKVLVSWEEGRLNIELDCLSSIEALAYDNKRPRDLIASFCAPGCGQETVAEFLERRLLEERKTKGAYRAVRWFFELLKSPAPLSWGVDGCSFTRLTVATQALMRPSGLVLNGTAPQSFADELQTAIKGSAPYHRITVAPKVTSERVWMPTTLGSKKELLRGSKVISEALEGLLERVIEDLESNQGIKRVLLGSHQAVFKALAGNQGDKLRDLIKAREGELALTYWGAPDARGSNLYLSFDAAYSIGDPLSGSGAVPEALEGSEEWERSQGIAAEALTQFFERLRAVSAEEPKRLVHLGRVLPKGWHPGNITAIPYQARGAKCETKAPEGWHPALKSLVAATSIRKTMQLLEVKSRHQFDHWLANTRTPPSEIATRILSNLQ